MQLKSSLLHASGEREPACSKCAGHRAAKRARPAGVSAAAAEAMSKHEAAIMLGEYMAGSGDADEAFWEALGVARQPVIGGAQHRPRPSLLLFIPLIPLQRGPARELRRGAVVLVIILAS